jgi:hypothetical protein
MSLRSRIALVILLLPAPLGCAKPWLNAVKPQPTANALKQDESTSPQTTEGERILALFAASGEPVAFRNPPLPPGAVDPLANATHLYSRARSKNPRSSAMDIEVWLLDSAGRPLHANHPTAINAAFAEVYGWNPETWESELKAKKVPDVQREKTLRDRSDFFWEPLAQNLASELFGSPEYKGTSQPVPDAKVILVRTTIPGERDLLYSVSRRISMAFHRDDMTRPELALEVFVPRAMRLPTLPPVG